MNIERVKRMEQLYSELRQAYELLKDAPPPFKDIDGEDYPSIEKKYSISLGTMWGAVSMLPLTKEEVKTIAKWKVEALEAELLSYQEKRP